jgi:Zn-finger nucleic acid-binding protein
MQCPNCQTTLLMSERQGIEIDYCPQCRGVWLDRGELDKLIDRSNQEVEVAPPLASTRPAPAKHVREERYGDERYRDERYRDERYGDRYEGKYKKKKSVWGEIFDF